MIDSTNTMKLTVAIILLSTMLAQPACGQTVASTPLPPPNARLDGEFSVVSSVRELPNGQVLISDEKENRLLLADFTTQRVSTIGRTGNGPGEYRQVGRLWALGGDSTMMADPFARRWLVFSGGRIVSTRQAVGRAESGQLLGVDRAGRVVYALHSMTGGKLSGLRDSMYVVRIDGARRMDTVGRIPSEYQYYDRTKPPPMMKPGGMIGPRVYKASLGAFDHVTMLADGTVVLVRSQPYRVDFCRPAMKCVSGPIIAEQARRTSEADKQAYLRVNAPWLNWPANISPSKVTDWPEFMPVLAARANRIDGSPLIVTPDGRLLVERVPTPDWPGLEYDVIDARGVRTGRLRLPPLHMVVGVGATAIYTVVTDDDNMQHLQRHPWK